MRSTKSPRNEKNSGKEFGRIGRVVGKEGRITQRRSLGGVSGSWANWVSSINTLIGDLVHPTEEVARVIGDSGDLGFLANGSRSRTKAVL